MNISQLKTRIIILTKFIFVVKLIFNVSLVNIEQYGVSHMGNSFQTITKSEGEVQTILSYISESV